jgi:hypothetical protein
MFWLFYIQLAQVDFLESGEPFLDSPLYLSKLLSFGNFSENSPGNQFLCSTVGTFLNFEASEKNPCLRVAEFTLNEVSKNFQAGTQTIPLWGDFHHVKFGHRIFTGTFLECLFDREVRKGGDTFTLNVGEVQFGKNSKKKKKFFFSHSIFFLLLLYIKKKFFSKKQFLPTCHLIDKSLTFLMSALLGTGLAPTRR